MKKPAGSHRRKSPTDSKKSNGKWLWMAVTCGKGKDVYTHKNHKKRVTFKLLPPHDLAMDGKTRGWKEIQDALKTRVHKGSSLVFDKWAGTIAACRRAGYTYNAPVNHSLGFRDRVSGFHSNDVESENNRMKQWLRERYSCLKLGRTKTINNDTVLDLYEYVFKVNVGESFADAMGAIGSYIHEPTDKQFLDAPTEE